jgi:hypothetical protein
MRTLQLQYIFCFRHDSTACSLLRMYPVLALHSLPAILLGAHQLTSYSCLS